MITSKNCMVCSACIEVCPRKCISIGKDNYGTEKIVVDNSKCINCGRCSSVCQIEEAVGLSKIREIHVVARNNDDLQFRNVTAAGIATLISMWFIKHGGCVVGVRWDMQQGAIYDFAENLSGLGKFEGSKYVYPVMSGIYSKTCELCKTKKVLFIGLPCHIAGLKKIMGGENENLFTIDLICHGAPEKSYLDAHLKALGLDREIKEISFRNGEKYRLFAKTHKKELYRERCKDTYLYGFLNGLIQKEYCYSCRYAYDERIGDLTLGDAWGQKILNASHTELIAINNDKGKQLFDAISGDLIDKMYNLTDFKMNNQQMKMATQRHPNREVFLLNLKDKGFEKAAKSALNTEMSILRLKKLFSNIKNILRGKPVG